MITTIADSFGFDSEVVVEDLLREESTQQVVSQFLGGGSSAPSKILFYFQRPDIVTESGELVDSEAEPRLFVTLGDSERLKSKAVYFVRNTAGSKGVSLSVANDTDVLFGEIGPSPLQTLDTMLTELFSPMVSDLSGTDWGHCEDDQRKEFLAGMEKFVSELSEAMHSLSGGVELKKPDRRFEVDARVQGFSKAAQEPELVSHYESLLEDWCKQIEEYLEETPDGRWDGNEAGPHTELEYWRGRLQRLTSITEQLKSKESKMVFGVLTAVTKVSQDVAPKSRQSIFNLLRRWKQIDINITEALNEAKDNVKYLTTLEKFIEPLYNGTPLTIWILCRH